MPDGTILDFDDYHSVAMADIPEFQMIKENGEMMSAIEYKAAMKIDDRAMSVAPMNAVASKSPQEIHQDIRKDFSKYSEAIARGPKLPGVTE